jgi:hypothetical protein
MKIKGKKLDAPVVETIVIPRVDRDIVFQAKAVRSYADFDALCPRPIPATIMRPDGTQSQDVEDPEFKKAIETWAMNRSNWMILKALEATEGLEWETVKMNDPSTWGNYGKELEETNLSQIEINRIINICITANGLDQAKIDKATESFLAGQAARQSKQ